MFKKIVLMIFISALMVSFTGVAQAEKEVASIETPTGKATVLVSEHFISLFVTSTNLPRNNIVKKDEIVYKPAVEVTGVLKSGNFSLVPAVYYNSIEIDKGKGEYIVRPALNLSFNYEFLKMLNLRAGYATDMAGKYGPVFGVNFTVYDFGNGIRATAGLINSQIGENVNSIFAGITLPID